MLEILGVSYKNEGYLRVEVTKNGGAMDLL
jgi:hypothetical protein